MMVHSILLLSIFLGLSRCRSIDLDMDNDINVGVGSPSHRYPEWVKISQAPKRIISRNMGSHLELECEVMGSPPPTLQWYKEDKLLSIPNDQFETNMISSGMSSPGLARVKGKLVFNYLLPVHDGTFSCVAQSGSEKAVAESRLFVVNKGGLEMNFTTLLRHNVLGGFRKPRITLWAPTYMDVIGKGVDLPCQSVGNPKPDLRWLDPQREVVDSNNGRVSVLPDGTLRIRSVSWADMGPYSCIVRNSLGEDTAETFLYPMQES